MRITCRNLLTKYSFLSFLLILSSLAISSNQQPLVFAAPTDHPLIPVGERILQSAYSPLNVTIQVRQLPPMRALSMSNQGELDGSLGRVKGIDQTYKNLLMIPIPLCYIEFMAFSYRSVKIPNGWQDVKPYHIGILKGGLYIENKTHQYNKELFNTPLQLLRVVSQSRIELGILGKVEALKALKQLDNSNIKIVNPTLDQVAIYHYLHKKHAKLKPFITKSLLTMQKNGTLKKTYDQFINSLMSQ
ncbi:substrate-binding periplasmic protein [Zooshikella sp. RANM57]|uniref:substrate-binding periplasmic protein n=1 Tax=Zooshikella sp. RANM57 TaxID=3425863 RepID=UPI003D6E38C6